MEYFRVLHPVGSMEYSVFGAVGTLDSRGSQYICLVLRVQHRVFREMGTAEVSWIIEFFRQPAAEVPEGLSTCTQFFGFYTRYSGGNTLLYSALSSTSGTLEF